MYADTITESMRHTIDETNRRRKVQMAYNEEHHITPTTIHKAVQDVIAITRAADADDLGGIKKDVESMSHQEVNKLIQELTKKMRAAATELNFEDAAKYRDKIEEIRKTISKEE